MIVLSDMTEEGGVGIMNLHAFEIPDEEEEFYTFNPTLIKLTSQCSTLIPIQSFDVDSITNDIIYKSGADVYIVKKEEVEEALENGGMVEGEKMEIRADSDFIQAATKLIKAEPSHYTSFDVRNSLAVSTVRGQAYILPLKSPWYLGSSSPIPPRRHRLFPSTTSLGAVRVFNSQFLNETHTITLSTDLESWNTAEIGIYLLNVKTSRSTKLIPGNGDLKSPNSNSFTVSPTGEHCAWWDTDGNLKMLTVSTSEITTLETWIVEFGTLKFSRDGEYLAFTHSARNQFTQITVYDIKTKTLTHVTSDRFNCNLFTWGEEGFYYTSDRDVYTDQSSPWGTRAPSPHFVKERQVYVIPYNNDVMVSEIAELKTENEATQAPTASPSTSPNIDFDLTGDVIHRAYPVLSIPLKPYTEFLAVTSTSAILTTAEGIWSLPLTPPPPSSPPTPPPTPVHTNHDCSISSDYISIYCETSSGFSFAPVDSFSGSPTFSEFDTEDMFTIVHPRLEWMNMYGDSWRMLRDYFYDKNMHGLDWESIYEKYLPLVDRVNVREELDDVFKQMAGELSALHVFVYGGEYRSVFSDQIMKTINKVAKLGANLKTMDRGMEVQKIYEGDPDFPVHDHTATYSPLSHVTLSRSGQIGIVLGDVITHINGEHVLAIPGGLSGALRGMAGRSVKLSVEKVETGENVDVITVPITGAADDDLRYTHWEYQTMVKAKQLGTEKNFKVGYIHLRSMSGAKAENAFARGFFGDYDKQGMIIDVRNNHGGNIDSWILDALQRKAWMYWESRNSDITNGGLGWDEQFAFRGKIVVLMNEHTASDGEGFSRGMKTLNLGTLVGTRTWGGGIWLSSDNRLVDGGLGGSAPEVGTYNDEWGWGLGVENMGVEPDVVVDNDPHATYRGEDAQLEKGIEVLKEMIESDTDGFSMPNDPGPKKNVQLPEGTC
ncbi:hypothetical protein TrVE_jg1505 [Triparma verrucosa]|uniref:Tail specific protease domain-containing protein n=1 Tax=Triparma verrucosa TaxID=1606542 RepID=A0A9W7BBC7_9STRA|nr:hypothetical protein TrVE_jg1505 [Triparma verrucosa]